VDSLRYIFWQVFRAFGMVITVGVLCAQQSITVPLHKPAATYENGKNKYDINSLLFHSLCSQLLKTLGPMLALLFCMHVQHNVCFVCLYTLTL
jgi:hypothetical protein